MLCSTLVVLQVLTRIRGFAAMNKLKKEALKVIAVNLPDEEIVGLKAMFEAMDKDGRWGAWPAESAGQKYALSRSQHAWTRNHTRPNLCTHTSRFCLWTCLQT